MKHNQPITDPEIQDAIASLQLKLKEYNPLPSAGVIESQMMFLAGERRTEYLDNITSELTITYREIAVWAILGYIRLNRKPDPNESTPNLPDTAIH